MANGATPKKIVESGTNCFKCSSAAGSQNRIFVFGKSSLNLPEIIRSSLDVDVDCYAENRTELFVCRDICYKRLQKFQQAAEKLSEVKKKIEEAFNSRQWPRAKRLTTKEAAATYPAPKASKSLEFGASTTCTSSIPRAQFHGLVSPPVEKEHRRFEVNMSHTWLPFRQFRKNSGQD